MLQDQQIQILMRMHELEKSIGELYSLFSEKFPECGKLWIALSRDEQGHAEAMRKLYQVSYEGQAVFEEENINSLSLTNRVMHAFIEEAEEKLSGCTDAEVKDACLLACIQAINHFKISTDGTAAAFANTLGMEKQASVFHEAEINEKQIDDRLSQLAEHEINVKAKAPIVLTG